MDLMNVFAVPLTFQALDFDRSVVLYGVELNCYVFVVECCLKIRSYYGASSVRGVWIPLSLDGSASLLPSDGFRTFF